jgi:hypothetical protein
VGKEEEEVWFGTYLDEKAVFEIPTVGDNMSKLREILLICREGRYSDSCAMEVIFAGRDFTGDKLRCRRSYKLGFTTTPDETRAGMASTNTAMLQNKDKIATMIRLIANVAKNVLEAHAPKEILDILKHQASVDVPMTFGSMENKYFSKSSKAWAGNTKILMKTKPLIS